MAKTKRRSKPEARERKPMVVQMRGSLEWKQWIEKLAAKEHDTVAKFIERLAYHYAKQIDFEEMPER